MGYGVVSGPSRDNPLRVPRTGLGEQPNTAAAPDPNTEDLDAEFFDPPRGYKTKPENEAAPDPAPDPAPRQRRAEDQHPANDADDLTSDLAAPAKPERRANPLHVPMRKGRVALATAANIFLFLDALMIATIAMWSFSAHNPVPILGAPLMSLLPYISAAVLTSWALWTMGVYSFSPYETILKRHIKVTIGFMLAGALSALAVVPFVGWAHFQRTIGVFIFPTYISLAAVHAGYWALVVRWAERGALARNVVIVGATENAKRLIHMNRQTQELNIIGIFDDRLGRAPNDIHGVPVLGTTEDLLTWRQLPQIDQVIVTVTSRAQGRVRELIGRLRVMPNPVTLFLDLDDIVLDPSRLVAVARSPLAYVSGQPDDDRRAVLKRVQDLVIGTVALVVFAPVMLATAIAIRLESPGPVLFRQKRHGFNNEIITVYKFRSMRHEAADAKGAKQVAKDDDRVTKGGRIIRKTSIDELPQIINVLKGEMSLVGPRPHAIGMKASETEVHKLVSEYAHRHRVKPGITGWAQINGSRGACTTAADIKRRVELDVEYINRASTWFDLLIMIKTLPAFLGDSETVR